MNKTSEVCVLARASVCVHLVLTLHTPPYSESSSEAREVEPMFRGPRSIMEQRVIGCHDAQGLLYRNGGVAMML